MSRAQEARLLAACLVALTGCAQLLGFEDPTGGTGDDADDCARIPVFGSPTNYPVGFESFAWAVGDLDHDALPDLVATGPGGASLIVWHGTGSGTFGRQEAVPLPAPCAGGYQIAADDVDGDGFDDLTVFAVNGGCNGAVYSLLQDPTDPGTFLAPSLALENVDPMAPFSLGDLDGDERLDIALADSGGVAIAYHSATTPGTFEAAPRISLSGLPPDGSAPLVDLDEDGRLDILLLISNRTNVLYQSDTDGDFRAPVQFGPSGVNLVGAGNFTDDDLEDLILSDAEVTQIYAQVDGSPGTFEPGATLTLPPSYRLAVVDVNGDGRLDVRVGNTDTQYLLQCDAAADTFSTTARSLGYAPFTGDTLDVDGDGYLDVVRRVDGDAVEVRLQTPP